MSMFGDSNYNKNDLYDNIEYFFKEGETIEELFDVIHTVFEYGYTPKDILQERIDKAIEFINECTRDEDDEPDIDIITNLDADEVEKLLDILKGVE